MEPAALAYKLVTENKPCTLATASKTGKPQAATMQYAADGFTLYFETMSTYRKYANLQENPQASVVITQLQHTLQMDGTVEELSGKNAENAKDLLIASLGKKPGFYSSKELRLFKFTPTWIRVLASEGWPPEFYEVTLEK